ncbi:MAG: oxygenase MpaB family protein, partial [Acidimicrobiales bacterium]
MDRRALLLAGRALMLQVMHPTVGAGVRDFSTYRQDPWGRLERTVRSLLTQIFGGEAAVDEATRLRSMHARIRGTGFDGRHYSALEPGAQVWVHLSNFDTMLELHRGFAHPLGEGQAEQLYTEWLQVGRLLGLRDKHLPPDLEGFTAYMAHMTTDVLSPNETARQTLRSLVLEDVPPPVKAPLAGPAWSLSRFVLSPLVRFAIYDTTVGSLPPVVRHKLGLEWTTAQERRMRCFADLVRHTMPLVPERIREYPLAYRAKQAAR